jgi:hypothetical protein
LSESVRGGEISAKTFAGVHPKARQAKGGGKPGDSTQKGVY